MSDNEELDINQSDSDNDSNNTNNNATNSNAGKTVVIGCDTNNSNDKTCQDTVARACEAAGYKPIPLDIGPNEYASYSYSGDAKGKLGVYLMAASLLSFLDAAAAGFDYNVLGIRGDVTEWTDQEWETKQIPKDHHGDCTIPECDTYQGKTYPELNEIYKGKCIAVPGETNESLAQHIVEALGGQYNGLAGGTNTGSSSGGAQIKDKTFEDCIRRICAATDSVFLVENNAAVLFPYTDWMAFTLRHQIKQIKAKDMDPDLFEIDYNTDGFYNKVTVVWGADEEQDKTTPDQQNEEEEKKGNVTTIQKTMPTGGTQLSEQYDPLVEIYGELEKKVTTNFPNEETAHFVMNALLIQYIRDFNNSCRTRVINNQKFIGGTFYAVENPNTNESELFYLNSYTMFKEKDQPLVTDIEFKYGPESAEELLDYQFYGGGSGGSVAGGASNDTDVPAEVKELVNQVCQGITDPYQKMVAIHNYLKDRIKYDSHSCRRYAGPKECLQHMDDLNCADTTTLTVACMLAAGLDAVAVHGDNHFWTVITINGKEYASDAVSSYHDIGDVYVDSSGHGEHFNDGGPYYAKEGKMPQCTES